MRERVLVSGATGFVGRHVIGPLAELGFEVHGIGRRMPSGRPPMVFHALDLFDHGEVARLFDEVRPTRVLHLAWYVEHGLFWDSPENAAWASATLQLARTALATGVGRFVGLGTCAEYDPEHQPGRPRREDDPLAFSSAYARAKIETARDLGALFEGTGVTFAWARLFHLYGPGEARGRLVPSLLDALDRDRPFVVAAPAAVRDYSCTVDVGRQLALLVACGFCGAMNIASGVPTTIGDFARSIAADRGQAHLIESNGEGGAGDEISADVGRARSYGIQIAPERHPVGTL